MSTGWCSEHRAYYGVHDCPLLSARETLRMFKDYRWAVGRTIHDLGGYKGLAQDLGPLGDRIEAALAAVPAHTPGALDVSALRSPRNSLGKLALPKGLMERAVEAAWDGATSTVGNPADGIEMHNLADLADGICDFLQAYEAASEETK